MRKRKLIVLIAGQYNYRPATIKVNIWFYPYHDPKKEIINRSPFELSFAGILHLFSVASGEDDEAVAPLSVT